MKVNWKQFFLYHIRWQSGIFLLWPTLEICSRLRLSNLETTLIFQFIGACVYYFIDKFIFNLKKKKV